MNFKILISSLICSILLSCNIGLFSGKGMKVGKEITTESGLIIELLAKGDGMKVDSGDIVSVHYTGKLTNDTVFDSSIPRGNPIKFALGEGKVIKGWDEGLSYLNVGDKAKFTIPAELGYGDKAVGEIPANSILIFEVEVVTTQKPPKPFDVTGKDTLKTESGLQYIIVHASPDSASPKVGDNVKVHYSGYLTDGSMFDSSLNRGEAFEFPLGKGRVIKGWDEGVALLKKGEKARLIIPYQLGYGEAGYPPVIPESATLIFDVELLDFNN